MKHGAGVHKLNARQADMTPGQKQQFVFDMVKEEMGSSVYMREAAWGLYQYRRCPPPPPSPLAPPPPAPPPAPTPVSSSLLSSWSQGRGALEPPLEGASSQREQGCHSPPTPSSLSVPGPCPLGLHSGAPMPPGISREVSCFGGGRQAEALLHRVEHNICPSALLLLPSSLC